MVDDHIRADARALWRCFETIHAVTYFASESIAATSAVGIHGFWRTYFGFRAAPLGACSPATVTATFFGFAPAFVERAVPDVWDRAQPATYLEARASAAAKALRRLVPSIEELAETADVMDRLTAASVTSPSAGRPLYAVNRALPIEDDPVAQLWQTCTTLREHRGDGHIAALTATGLTPPEALVLFSADVGMPASVLQNSRGWTDEEWGESHVALVERGLINACGTTGVGHAMRADIERTTDRLAAAPFASLGDDQRHHLLLALTPAAATIAESGLIPFPNPIGLERTPPLPVGSSSFVDERPIAMKQRSL